MAEPFDRETTDRYRRRATDETQGCTLGDLDDFVTAAFARGYERGDVANQRPKGRGRIAELSVRRADPES